MAALGSRLESPLLRDRGFLLLAVGQAVSRVGDGVYMAALAWTAWRIGRSASAVAIVTFAGSGPAFFMTIVGASYADRFDRRALMIGSDLARLLLVLVLALLLAGGGLSVAGLALLAAAIAVISGPLRAGRARRAGGRVIAVGTTSVRALESAAACTESCAESQEAVAGRARLHAGWTDLFITPGYEFLAIDGLITNFHLPRSTLLLLVSALIGRERLLAAYAEAIRQRYRFYSFGDAMLVI
jgi:hypothetical protein